MTAEEKEARLALIKERVTARRDRLFAEMEEALSVQWGEAVHLVPVVPSAELGRRLSKPRPEFTNARPKEERIMHRNGYPFGLVCLPVKKKRNGVQRSGP